MLIRAGYEITYECYGPTPMLLMLSVLPEREPDLRSPQEIRFDRFVGARNHTDNFGNTVTRVLLPEGRTTISADFLIHDSGLPDPVNWNARQHPVEELPAEVLQFLFGSRYCDTDLLSAAAWSMFGGVQPGWARVQAICDHVNQRLRFSYDHARNTRSASQGAEERVGVCRDFAHLAVTYCRCMNIPARYVTGYLGDIGIPPVDYPMDFSAWFQVFLDGGWHTFDARHNTPRIGRVLMATGRDATDVALSTAFGTANLIGFNVVTDEVPETTTW